jgi:hypothetical protein
VGPKGTANENVRPKRSEAQMYVGSNTGDHKTITPYISVRYQVDHKPNPKQKTKQNKTKQNYKKGVPKKLNS